jgi:hypothetical protein
LLIRRFQHFRVDSSTEEAHLNTVGEFRSSAISFEILNPVRADRFGCLKAGKG